MTMKPWSDVILEKHPHRGVDLSQPHPFDKLNVFGEGDSMHNFVQTIHAKRFKNLNSPSKNASSKEWKELFTTTLYKTSSIPDDKCITAIKLGTQLVVTDPKILHSFGMTVH